MKKLTIILCTTVMLLCIAGVADATPILDQQSIYDENQPSCVNASAFSWQQEVVVGTEGLLTQIAIYATEAGNIDFYINTGSALQTDTNDYYSFLELSAGWNYIDVSSADLIYDEGDTFVIGIGGINGGAFLGICSTSGYGALYSVDYNREYEWDLAFQTYMDPDYNSTSPVPEPATLLLLGSGLIGIAGLTRRKRT